MNKQSINFNRFLYISFVLLGFYYLLSGQYSEAPLCFGVALAFDPFDPKQTWEKRQLWKKFVLIAHLALTASIFGYLIGFQDK